MKERSLNFGDILNKWEKQSPKAGTEIDGVASRETQSSETQFRGLRRSRLLRKRPDAKIDLHGLNQDEAWTALDSFFENSSMMGHEKVLIIHGKGNHRYVDDGVLRDLSRRFIESCSHAGESGYCAAKEGGSGATWVILKEN